MEEYKVLKALGEGSFGRVLLVHHRFSDQKYAMKKIRLPMNSRKEAVLLAKIKHPNIVAYKESFEADGHLYIVMEYCDDGDLMQKIKHQGGNLFSEDMILQWFVQMCLAVKHIHDKRVLHRDIKSKNIFLTQNGKVKLGDFGSAHLLAHPMSYACTYVGTPYYVPPEVWESMPYNNKSDIWSLGCILYELCTLKHLNHRIFCLEGTHKVYQSPAPGPAQDSPKKDTIYLRALFKSCISAKDSPQLQLLAVQECID